MTLELVMQAIKTFGLPVALLLFMLWQGSKRKEQDRQDREEQTNRINALEDYQKNELSRIAVESATALQNNAEANREATATHRELVNNMRQLTLSLRTRPCLDKVVDIMERDAS